MKVEPTEPGTPASEATPAPTAVETPAAPAPSAQPAPEAPATEPQSPTNPPATPEEPKAPEDSGRGRVDMEGYNERRNRALQPPKPKAEPPPGTPAEPAAAAPTPPEPAPAPPQQPAAETPQATPTTEAAPPVGTPAPAPEQPPASKADFRPRLNKLPTRQQEAISLVRDLADKGEEITLTEAERRIAIKYDGTAEPAAPPAPKRTVAEIEGEIAQAKSDKKAAAEKFDRELTGATALVECDERIEALRAELDLTRRTEANAAREAETAEERAFDEAVAASRAAVIEQFPDAAAPNHQINAVAKRMFDALPEDDPDRSSPGAPLKYAKLAAQALGIAPGTTTQPSTPTSSSAPAAVRPQPVVQQAEVRPAPAGVAPGSARTTPQAGQSVASSGKSRSVEDYEAKKERLGIE